MNSVNLDLQTSKSNGLIASINHLSRTFLRSPPSKQGNRRGRGGGAEYGGNVIPVELKLGLYGRPERPRVHRGDWAAIRLGRKARRKIAMRDD